MKYLKEYNQETLYQSFDFRINKGVIRSFPDNGKEYVVNTISEKNFDILKKLYNTKKYVLTKKVNSAIVELSKHSIYVFESDDYYFFCRVFFNNNHNISFNYMCDTIDGVIQLIKYIQKVK